MICCNLCFLLQVKFQLCESEDRAVSSPPEALALHLRAGRWVLRAAGGCLQGLGVRKA